MLERTITLAFVTLITVSLSMSYNDDNYDDRNVSDFRLWQEFRAFERFKANYRDKSHKDVKTGNYDDTDDVSDKVYRQIIADYKDEYLRNEAKNEKNKSAHEDPPPIDKAALMARYIVNQAAWTSVATISSRQETLNYPFANVISCSDGPVSNGTGVPYLYLTPLDFTAQDAYKDSRSTLLMTLAQGSYCTKKDYDPMDPRCARVVLAGKIKAISKSSPELLVAQSAVFGRHPWLAHMPEDHHFFFAKLKIGNIAVLDTFGGPKYVTVKDYFSAKPEDYAVYQIHQK